MAGGPGTFDHAPHPPGEGGRSDLGVPWGGGPNRHPLPRVGAASPSHPGWRGRHRATPRVGERCPGGDLDEAQGVHQPPDDLEDLVPDAEQRLGAGVLAVRGHGGQELPRDVVVEPVRGAGLFSDTYFSVGKNNCKKNNKSNNKTIAISATNDNKNLTLTRT